MLKYLKLPYHRTAINPFGRILLILFLISNALVLNAQAPILVSASQKETTNIWPNCCILEDEYNSYQVKDLLDDTLHFIFKETKGTPSTFGFTSSTYWIKFKTKGEAGAGPIYLTIERV